MAREGKTLAVWTLIEFKKGKLQLFPNTTEIKDRYCTQGRACLTKTDNLAKGKNLALDGRLASKVPEGQVEADQVKPFSLFWVIPRTIEKASSNLVLEYAKCTCDIKVTVGAGSKRNFENSESMDIPYLCNPKDIAAGTKLAALDDLALHKICKAMRQA